MNIRTMDIREFLAALQADVEELDNSEETTESEDTASTVDIPAVIASLLFATIRDRKYTEAINLINLILTHNVSLPKTIK